MFLFVYILYKRIQKFIQEFCSRFFFEGGEFPKYMEQAQRDRFVIFFSFLISPRLFKVELHQ